MPSPPEAARPGRKEKKMKKTMAEIAIEKNGSKLLRVKSEAEAWKAAAVLADYDYDYDAEASSRAGYPVYSSTNSAHVYSHICDLNARLEVCFEDYSTVNIWIEAEAEQPEQDQDQAYINECKARRSANISAVVVIVTTKEGNEARRYSVPDLLQQIRFFWSSGRPYADFEKKLEAARRAAELTIDENGFSAVVSFVFSGLRFDVMNGERADYMEKYGKM